MKRTNGSATSVRGGAVRWLVLVSLLFGLGVIVPAQQDDEPDALAAYRNRNYQQAIEITREEIEARPRNMDSYTVLGWSLNALGRYQEALDWGRRALEISRYDHRIIQIMAEAHYNLENNMQALQYLEEYVAIAPEGRLVDQVYYQMGEVFMRFEEYHHADVAFTAALHYGTESAGWWARLGLARERAGSLSPALNAYNRALELNGNLEAAQQGRSRVREALSS
jgi:tetratricopeptide (TPR) repeat protein